MKNKNVYDNYDDALKAFEEMCASYEDCCNCPYENEGRCEIRWLFDEAREPEKWQKNILDKFSNKE